ncbi:MAG: methylamine utilization protein MauG [Gammaproteobacteria bacterium]|nr:methylamine utilization protein MauG [Gammaproteobacteria bacterium]
MTSLPQLQAAELPEQLVSEDFQLVSEAKARIGHLLFYDPILSGNRNISCGTCHNPQFGTSDGLSLGIGEGGTGSGPQRNTGSGGNRIRSRIPRNSPGLWNLGAKEITKLFHDGRLSISDIYGNGFNSPAQEWLPSGLDSILAAQALFPMTSQFEMAGDPKENEVAGAAHDRIDAVWPILAKRVRTIPEYGNMFVAAFEDVRVPSDVNITHIANAIGAFEALEWRSSDSPFDAYLAGNHTALSEQQKRGLEIFFGRGGCANCHSGKLFTDHGFHALALPQFGPGRTRNFDPYVRDVGRMGETDHLEDAYRFRTPSLRNVALTAPYGHNGAYQTLHGIIRHHLDPLQAFERWNRKLAALPVAPWLASIDFVSFEDRRERMRLKGKLDIQAIDLMDEEIDSLVSFLGSLTGTGSLKGRFGKPERVPSGLKVD